MYDTDFKVSSRYANSTKAFVTAAINSYNEANTPDEPVKKKSPYYHERNMIMENMIHRDSVSNRYHSFSESVRNILVVESLYKIFKESVSDEIKNNNVNLSIMRSIVSQYVHENNYAEILNRMKTASIFMAEMYNTITDTTKAILEGVDKSDPSTFTVTPEMKDDFFKQLEYSDSEAISDAIKSRVSDSIQDFVTANTKDHEDITAALQQAQEKINSVPEEDVSVRESYEMRAKRKIAEIRNAPKNVFHAMVSAMCESVLKHPETHYEFMNEGHLDIDKIVNRVSLMYTFMEMLNTARIDKVDSAFIESVIKNLSN